MNYSGEKTEQQENAREMASDSAGKSTLISRNITVVGRRTSVRLEPEMWSALREIAKREDCKIHDICSLIHLRKNPDTSLTAAIRVFLMLYYRAAATEEGIIVPVMGILTTWYSVRVCLLSWRRGKDCSSAA